MLVGHRKSYVAAAFALLGVNSSRLVTGSTFAKVAYLPEPVACGKPPFALLQLTRKMLLDALQRPGSSVSGKPVMLVIKRLKTSLGGRNIDNFDEILAQLRQKHRGHVIQVHTGEEPWEEQLRARPAKAIFRVSVCAARTLNATGPSRVTLSLQ